MALFTKTASAVSPAPALIPASSKPMSMIASAVRMTLSEEAWRGYRFTDESWQKVAWEFYDTNEQLHNAVDYVGNACSLVRIYVANVDENGVRQDEVSGDPEIAALADTLFGGPAAKAEILRTLAESITVAGECYLIGLSARPAWGDKWMVLAPSEVRKQGKVVWVNVGHAVRETLNPGRDIIVRVHTPHPRRPLLADSPVRALMDTLHRMREIQLFKRSQFNSRIANAVVLPVPESLAVPKGDDETPSVDDIYQQLFEVMTSNLEGKGTAAQIAPILWPMPLAELEAMKGMQPIRFESVLSEVLAGMEKQEMEKLAIGINVPVEIQLGAKEMNHWGVWFAGEEFIVKSIMPIMGRIVDAITTAYLQPALKALGKDPNRYTYWYDVAPLASSANQAVDTLNLYEKGVVSAETVRRAFNYRETDAPSKDESGQRFTREVILRDPQYFAVEPVREYAGVEGIETALPELPELNPSGPPPPPRPERGIEGPRPGQGAPNTRPSATQNQPESELIASLAAGPSTAHVAANSMVVRALEVANKKLLTPSVRKAHPNSDILTLHTKVHVNEGQVAGLLAGAWDHCGHYMYGVGVDQSLVAAVLNSYVAGLLTHRIEHHPSLMSARLRDAGIV
jgi:hypothetical protein